jgi:hypothetical protein
MIIKIGAIGRNYSNSSFRSFRLFADEEIRSDLNENLKEWGKNYYVPEIQFFGNQLYADICLPNSFQLILGDPLPFQTGSVILKFHDSKNTRRKPGKHKVIFEARVRNTSFRSISQ